MSLTPPREVKFSLLFFKALSGLGVGIIGMIVLLIFVLLGLGTASGDNTGPFLIFSAIVMGFITAMVSNCLGAFLFGMLDREKYADIRKVIKHIISLNILIFISLLPVYFFGIIGGAEQSLKIVFLIATLQLVVSAISSMFTLELSNSKSSRENFLAIYGITFAILITIIVNVVIYQVGQVFSSQAELATGGSGGKGPTAVLFAILPTTWLFFGAFTSAVEMIYRWIYQTWGKDSLNE